MPTLSLIEDNINYVRSVGIAACELSGNNPNGENDHIVSEICRGR
jgi:superfamily II DNA helicase RecQ